ncbi:MAG: ABC transporter substrate-binding protein [Holosporaceae bacterium]|jgi:polar amino acid transport system substrate-binding protein|nr:ABC transporter substrate-binding protein [Holosporaceae bacterium]
MKKYVVLFAATLLVLLGCDDKSKKNEIKFATCADYPPFEFYENGKKLVGFDVELAEAIAKKLGKEAIFKDMGIAAINASVENGSIDAGIAALSVTEEKKKRFDFSNSYCRTSVSIVCKADNQITDLAEIGNEKIASQMGCTAHGEVIKRRAPQADIVWFEKMDAAIEALKAGHVDYVLLDGVPALEFCKNNQGLKCVSVGENEEDYAILLRKNSHLKEPINKALAKLKSEGVIDQLERKYLGK